MDYSPGDLVLVLAQVIYIDKERTCIQIHPQPQEYQIPSSAIVGPAKVLNRPLTPGDRVTTPTGHGASIIATASTQAWLLTDSGSHTVLPLSTLTREPK
jgi:hypothetical protein